MFRYSEDTYGVINYGEKMFPEHGVHPAKEIKVGDTFNSGIMVMQITEVLEQRKSKGTFKNDVPYWAKVKAKKV